MFGRWGCTRKTERRIFLWLIKYILIIIFFWKNELIWIFKVAFEKKTPFNHLKNMRVENEESELRKLEKELSLHYSTILRQI